MQGHRDLLVWQKAMRFVTDVYQMTKAFPKEEIYFAFNVGYIDAAIFSRMVQQSSEIGRMLTGLRSWAAGANS
jgi:hypothetical protein